MKTGAQVTEILRSINKENHQKAMSVLYWDDRKDMAEKYHTKRWLDRWEETKQTMAKYDLTEEDMLAWAEYWYSKNEKLW